MIDSTDTMSLIHKLVQPNIKTLIIISLVFILMMKYFDTNVVLILSFIVNIFIFHKQILGTFQEIQKSEVRTERIIEDNKREKKEIHFDEEINAILMKLRKYRKYNRNAYEEGYKYIKMFMFIIHDLEKDEISHPRQYFENAELYLKQALNNFQSISISVPEESLNQALKYNKFEATKLGNRIGKLCKRLHKHGYYLLYNLSLRLNESYFKTSSDDPRMGPNIYRKEITLNAGNVEPMDQLDYNWDLY